MRKEGHIVPKKKNYDDNLREYGHFRKEDTIQRKEMSKIQSQPRENT